MAKRKILYLITKSNWGGAQKYVYDLATALPRDQFDVTVALGGTGAREADSGYLKTILDKAGVRTIFLKSLTRDIYFCSEIFGFLEILKTLWREQPDILHLNSSKAAGIGAFWGRLLGIKKIIYTVHGWPFNEQRNFMTKAIIYFFSWLTVLFSHEIISISQSDFEQGKKMWELKDKMSLIHNGVKDEPLRNRDGARLELSKICQAQFDQSDIIGGTIAELHPNKGLDILIKAISQAKNNFKYVIIGDGGEKADLQEMIRTKNLVSKVFLAGFIPAAATYLPAFDFFVLPSLKEGLPYVLLEAGLAGLSAVGSDIPGIRDILADTGNPLFLVGDSGKLAGYLDGLAGDKKVRAALGLKLKDRVSQKFAFTATLVETIKIYQA